MSANSTETIITPYQLPNEPELYSELETKFMGKFVKGKSFGEMIWDIRGLLPNSSTTQAYIEESKLQISTFIGGWVLGRRHLVSKF